jgi:putative FmdB family regulatory protein
MPIYAYKCESCGHRQDVLQKISDPLLTVCPACGAAAFSKQVTAAGFQLKGSGWYVTDFRDNGSKKSGAAEEKDGDKGGDKPADKPAEAGTDKPAAPGSAAAESSPAAAAPASAPAAGPPPPASS